MAFAKLRCKVFAFALLLSLAFTGCGELHDAFREDANSNQTNVNRSQTPPAPESIHLAFGNPSKATLDPANDENFLIVGDGSVISYNNRRGTANWVSWKTTRADVGKTLPRPNFRPDPRLPGWYNRIGQYDYSGSGYDRGHHVRHYRYQFFSVGEMRNSRRDQHHCHRGPSDKRKSQTPAEYETVDQIKHRERDEQDDKWCHGLKSPACLIS